MAEWLRRLTRNEFPSGSVGSNPTNCDRTLFFPDKVFQVFQPELIEIVKYPVNAYCNTVQLRPCGLMDKAPDFGSGDCRFESCHGRIKTFWGSPPFLSFPMHVKMLAPGEARTHNPGISLCTVYKYRALTDCATGANCLVVQKSKTLSVWDLLGPKSDCCKVWGSNPRNISIMRA